MPRDVRGGERGTSRISPLVAVKRLAISGWRLGPPSLIANRYFGGNVFFQISVANGKVTATCRGTFVAVKEGHPAYHRW